jgi:uncharacterized membrane protein
MKQGPHLNGTPEELRLPTQFVVISVVAELIKSSSPFLCAFWGIAGYLRAQRFVGSVPLSGPMPFCKNAWHILC